MMDGFKVNVVNEKSRIANYISTHGPLVAHNVAKTLNLNSFLASALLSELLKDRVILSSDLKVGGSPLYYIKGQEPKLENFISFLKGKEKEAYAILKEKGVVEDRASDPAIRVAYRNIKDFAMPMVIVTGGQEKLFWRFYLLPLEEANPKIYNLLNSGAPMQTTLETPKPQVLIEEVKISNGPAQENNVRSNIAPEVKLSEANQKPDNVEVKVEVLESKKPAAKKIREPKKRSASFIAQVKMWMDQNRVSVKKEISEESAKDLKAVVEIESGIGKLDFLLLAKDKRAINEGDIALSYQEGFDFKLPIIFLTKGKLNKKAEEVAEGIKGRFMIRKL